MGYMTHNFSHPLCYPGSLTPEKCSHSRITGSSQLLCLPWGLPQEERNWASLSRTGSCTAGALSAGEAADEGSRLLPLPPSECMGGSWRVSLPFLSVINLPQRGAGTQIRGGMKEDKSKVSEAPHLLDNKQTPLLINFPLFPHGSLPLADMELGCSWPFWHPGHWGHPHLC